MSELEKRLRVILEQLVLNFASPDGNGDWWGYDTNLEDCKSFFDIAVARILKEVKA